MKKRKVVLQILCVAALCSMLLSAFPVSVKAVGRNTVHPSGEVISAEEVQRLTGESPKELLYAKGKARLTVSENVEFSKTIKDVTYGGRQYKVMEITAYPTGEGALYRAGHSVQTYDDSVKAKNLDVLKVAVNRGGKNKVIKKASMYDAAKKILKKLKIDRFEGEAVTYSWSVEEICSFIYVYDDKENQYTPAASYNKAKYIVGLSIPYAKEKNGKYYSGLVQTKYSGWTAAKHYGSTEKALRSFRQGKTYQSWVERIDIRGCKGKRIRSVSLRHPKTAGKLEGRN